MWKYFEKELPDDNRYIFIIWRNGKEEECLWKGSKIMMGNPPLADEILNSVLLWKYRGEFYESTIE